MPLLSAIDLLAGRHFETALKEMRYPEPRRHAQVADDLQGYAAAPAALIDPVRFASWTRTAAALRWRMPVLPSLVVHPTRVAHARRGGICAPAPSLRCNGRLPRRGVKALRGERQEMSPRIT